MKAGIEIPRSELVKFRRKIDRMTKEQAKEMQDHVNETALLIETDAKHTVPVITGRLRSSIHMESKNMNTNSTAGNLGGVTEDLTALVGTNVEYAASVEERKPYLEPALNGKARGFIEGIKRILK